MKLLFFDDYRLGVLKEGLVVDVTSALPNVGILKPQDHIEMVMEEFDRFRPLFEEIIDREEGVPIEGITIRPPLPRPHSILNAFDNYKDIDAPVRPLDFFLKGPGVIGQGETVVLADEPMTACYHPEPELGVVIGKQGKGISEDDALDHVFGYVNIIDVSARPDFKKLAAMGGSGQRGGANTLFKGKARDTWAPMGPVITTKDEIPDPQNLQVKLWLNGDLKQDFSTSLMMHSIPAQIAWLTKYITIVPGDVISTGTYHIGLSPINDGDKVEIEAEGMERLAFNVKGFGPRKDVHWAPPGPPPKGKPKG
jgi:2-keto-4-pentenoate hydratase/2-oxohepta-3-ene-1,7-dioic acid hydratase in catechol pathway